MEQKRELAEAELQKSIIRNGRMSKAKGFTLIVGIGVFLYAQQSGKSYGWFGLAGICIMLIILFLIHEKYHAQKEYWEARKAVIVNYDLRRAGEWKDFADTGEEFLGEESYLERDLDIFGEKSLFQYLCVAHTIQGKKKLAGYLRGRDVNSQSLRDRSEAVGELIEKTDFRLQIETLGYLSRKNARYKDDQWFYDFLEELEAEGEENKVLYTILRFFPLVLAAVGLYVFKTNSHFELIGIGLAVQLVMSYYTSYKNMATIGRMERFCLGLDSVIDMVECIHRESFESKLLKRLQGEMNDKVDLISGLSKLRRIKNRFDLRRNVYAHVLLQMLLVYDVQCVNQYRKWKKLYGKNIKHIFNVVGEVEALISLGTVAYNHEVSCADICESNTPVLDARDIYHPLIDSEKVVANSIAPTTGINIITGSNMSGKSTFMRTLGINLILAYAGAPVCAKALRVSIMELHTCMRVTDDVFQGRSSFYAEVLRIKSIIEASKTLKPIFVIIDEIFKGTNSIDRITGAGEIIKQLEKPQVMLWVSTHDLEICSLIENNQVAGSNYHFLESYRDNELLFDYKIKDGKCNSRNAKYILKMAGLTDLSKS